MLCEQGRLQQLLSAQCWWVWADTCLVCGATRQCQSSGVGQGAGEHPQGQVSSNVCMWSTRAQLCVLNAICVGCSQTSPCTAGGVLSRRCKKKPLSHAGSHTSVYLQNQASICSSHSPPVWDKPLQLPAAEKPKRHQETLGFSSLHSGLCIAAPTKPSLPRTPLPSPMAQPCPVPRLLGSQLPSQSAASPHRTACSERAEPQRTQAGMAVSFVYHEPGLLPDSSAPTASIKRVNHFLATRAPEKS